MEKLIIPKHPKELLLKITQFWNGEACNFTDYHACVSLSALSEGLNVSVEARQRTDARIPPVPSGQRVDGLWEYDVVEVFLAAENGHYLEIELGAGGHWLVYAFDGIRRRSHEYVDFKPEHRHEIVNGMWQSTMVIPWDMLPQPVVGVNAYAICQGEFLAYSSVPGTVADYHQPASFPRVSLER